MTVYLSTLFALTVVQALYGFASGLAVIVHRDNMTFLNRFGTAMSMSSCFGYLILTTSWAMERDWLKYTPLEITGWLFLHAIAATVVIVYHKNLLNSFGYMSFRESWISAAEKERIRKHGANSTITRNRS